MPTYDYRCTHCSSEFELFLSLAERSGESEKKICPNCSSNKLEVMMTFNGGIIDSANSCETAGCASGGKGCSGRGCPFSG